jgi:hypothetical protein
VLMTSVLRYVWYAAAVIAPTLAVTELAAQSRAIPAIRLPPGVLATRAPTATTTQTDYPSLSGAATVTEGESLRFRITASRPPEVSLPFAYTLSGDTAALQRPATTGRVTLNQGQSSAEIVLPTRDDAAVNGRRRIALTLIQAPTRVTSANVYRAAGIVLDNDAATASPTPTPTPTPPPPTVLPVVTLGNAAQVVEGGVLRFPVRLDAPAREPVSVALAITDPRRAAGGTRTAGLRIAEGALAAADDSQVNGARVVSVQLLRALGARLGSPGSARGQVTDNDVAPSASAAPTDQPSTMAPTATPAESASPAASASAIETASVATAVPSTEAQPTADNAAFVDPGGGGTGNGAPPAAPSEPGRGWPIWQLVLAVLAGLAALVAAATAAARALLRVTCTTQTGALAAPLSDLTLSSPEVKISAQVTPGEVITGEMSGFAAGRANRDGEQQ